MINVNFKVLQSYVMFSGYFSSGQPVVICRGCLRDVDSHDTQRKGLPSHLHTSQSCFVLHVLPLVFIIERSWFSSISHVKDVMVIKWALKSTPHVPHLPVGCNKRSALVQRGLGATRGQVCGSCCYLWANTACLFSSGKYRLLYKCTRRSDCWPDISCSQNDASH